MRKMMKTVDLLRLVTQISLVIIFSACDKSNPVNSNKPPCPGIVPTPPYNGSVWHPSGKFIGFNHAPLKRITFPYGEHCSAVYQLDGDSSGFWLIDADGTNQRRIFPYRLQTPSWSPDGQWIAFVGNAQIYKMQFTGTTFGTASVVQLTFEGRNFFPDWSPDGQWIVYDRTYAYPESISVQGIWIMSANGTNKNKVAEGSFPNWHPSKRSLIFVSRFNNFQVGIIQHELQTNEKIFLLDAHGNDLRHPRYSPDGTKIAFWSQPSASGVGNLWIMNNDGSNLRQLTTEGIDVSFGLPFSWSPDGSVIAYTYYRTDERSNNNGTLWTINVDTRQKKQLTFNHSSTN